MTAEERKEIAAEVLFNTRRLCDDDNVEIMTVLSLTVAAAYKAVLIRGGIEPDRERFLKVCAETHGIAFDLMDVTVVDKATGKILGRTVN